MFARVATILVCIALASNLSSWASAAGLGQMNATKITLPAPANLQAFTAPSACTSRLDAPNDCADALAHGRLLFTWKCDGCDRTWLAIFVVNGQPSTPDDIVLGASNLGALSVRPDQFKR